MTDELQLAYDFYKEGELTGEELDEHYYATQAHIEALNSRTCSRTKGIL